LARRDVSLQSDNLELLLDTMCNAFGCVMFIAILLSVLVQFAEVKAPDAGEQSPLRIKQLQIQLTGIQMTLRQLERAVQGQMAVVGLVTDDAQEAFTQLQRTKEQSRALEARRRARQEAVERVSRDAERQSAEAKKLDAQIAEVQSRLKDATKELAQKPEVETRKLKLPRLRASQKITVFFILKWNRLFVLRSVSASGRPGSVMASDVTYRRATAPGAGQVEVYEARRGRGIPINDGDWFKDARIAIVLRNTRPDRHSLQFAVYPDSYAAYLRVRQECLSEAGSYEINWHVMSKPDQPVVLKQGVGSVQ
jgi:hypothetical protein